MKKLIYPFIVLLSLGLFLTGCEEETDIVESDVTFLPKLEMEGPSSVVLDCGSASYDDPGVEATEGGEIVEVITRTEGKYFGSDEINTEDDYLISYVAYNKDSIPGAAQRSVFVPVCNGDLTSSIAGMYSANVIRNGTVDPTYQGLQYIFIKDLGNNVYQLSDAIGGYYDFGRGYGFHYAALGMQVTANDIPGNDFTHPDIIGVGDFGGELEMTEFSVDAANKKINFTTDWSFGFTFEVELTQVEL